MNIICRNIPYYVEDIGQGEPVVLLHGFTGSTKTWEFLIPLLSKDYRLIMVDLIGHGNSASPETVQDYSMEKVTEDLATILTTLNIDKANILGYSMGGRVALSFAMLYPHLVSSLLLESASPGLETEAERRIRRTNDAWLAAKIKEEGIIAFAKYWGDISLFESQKRLPEEQQLSIYEQRLLNSPIGLANSLLGMGTGSQPSWWNKLDSLTVPVLLMTGELDTKFCAIAAKMQSRLKQVKWAIINDVGHAIHMEDREKFGKIISGFLKQT